MSLLRIAFIAGILSVLAPCVLPVLPVILGGSLSSQKWYRPLIIVLSTAVCITLFTVLLKVSSLLIDVPQTFWTALSASIIILYGLTLVYPRLWDIVSVKLGLYKAHGLAERAKKHEGIWGDVLLGASLGPIFASCSPTYALLLSVVFPDSLVTGILYTLVYALGFSVFLLILAYGGRALIKKLSRAANPNGMFKKILGRILIVTGLLIVSGYMKKLEVALLDAGLFDVGILEQRLLDKTMDADTSITSELGVVSDHPGAKLLNQNYPAPDITGLDNWINGGNYSSLADLKGKVVLLDFWTYSCINCIRTLEALKSRHKKYSEKGLVIVGIHAPEFQFEKKAENVKKAVEEYGLEYAVVQDNNFETWKNFDNRYRPAKYIIDKNGVVRYSHFGEGAYEETEHVIQYLLGLDATSTTPNVLADYAPAQTRETYLGSSRFDSIMQITGGVPEIGQRRLRGEWEQTAEMQRLQSSTGSLSMKYYASEINLVMGNISNTTTVTVMIDGMVHKTFDVQENKLYNLWKDESDGLHIIDIIFSGSGLEAYAFTFG